MTPLRQRTTEEMQIRNLAPETQRAYLGHYVAGATAMVIQPAKTGA